MIFDCYGVAPVGAPHEAVEWLVKDAAGMLYSVATRPESFQTWQGWEPLRVTHLGGERDGAHAGTAETAVVLERLARHLLECRRDF